MNVGQMMLIVVGMAVVTYLPRLLPVFILEKLSLSPAFGRWLNSIPYAALGALIFPGILSIDAANPWIGLIGGAVACLFAILRLPILVIIIGSIFAVWLSRFWL
ncbi:AzlD domain-containing protein [Paenactinomyces guangxiensis]|uniref:AzlD domain-containing protein n=1 Tax=Paenactinomyces guangxiensis TaxID=1490290 RepID=A0A7W1WMN0_9BACL|nr:AzlD domain-containing protein [Paenactinomyces guangxiensis]MBA4492730.1 AzlD domain-containing protein [Paenactinomyces guangxiensis]MBH8590421.1 AzlD domain-containing protein [Paenactinomyces guangxiensis]